MKLHTRLLPSCLAAALPLFLLCSCVEKDKKAETPPPALEMPQHRTVIEPDLLPNRFRQTGYMVNEDKDTGTSLNGSNAASLDGLQLKVGANITTTQPIPLREAMKAIVKTKNMSLSWAPDVDQELLVDIDATANDNFYEAIDNILRQLDYFQEVEGATMVIKYRETKQYHIAMPFIKQDYSSTSGVKSLDSSATLGNTGNTFDIWENIKNNIDSLIATWSTSVKTPEIKSQESDQNNTDDKKKANVVQQQNTKNEEPAIAPPVSRQVSSTNSSYTIDKPVGLIIVHAPRSLQRKVSDYFLALEKELYKQIVIEAKIIEVQLNDSSSLGVNWHQILDNISFNTNLSSQRAKTHDKNVSDENRTDYSSSTESLNRETNTNTKTDSLVDSSTNTESTVQNSSGQDQTGTSTQTNTTDSTSTTTIKPKNASTSTDAIQSSAGSTIYGLNSGRDLSSKENNSVGLSDRWNMGSAAATAATVITNGTAIAETVSAGASLIAKFSFPDFIKALQGQGQTSILSNPKISVMNGQPALISVGKNVTYIDKVTTSTDDKGNTSYTVSTDKVLSGVGLALSAVVKKNNEIVMNLVPITSELEPILYKEFSGATIGLPVVNRREMNTTVTIKDGSMLVVGGLISDKEIKNGENFIPGTKDIPYLNRLFGYEEKQIIKRELIILLRPRIIN